MGQAPWMWSCSHLAPLSKHTFTGQRPCPATWTAPLQTPPTCSPGPAFLQKECLQPSSELLWVRTRFVPKLSRFPLSQSTWSLLPSVLPHRSTSVIISNHQLVMTGKTLSMLDRLDKMPLQQRHRELQTNIRWPKSRLESYSVDAVCGTKDLSLLLPSQKHESEAYEMKRCCKKYPAPFLTFWGALVLTKILLLQKKYWLLLCICLNQYGSCTWASFLNLRGSATLCCPLLDSMNPTPLNRVLEDNLLWKGHLIPSALTPASKH